MNSDWQRPMPTSYPGHQLTAQRTRRETTTAKPPTSKVTATLVTLMSVKEPGVVHDPATSSDLQGMPIMAGSDSDPMLWQEQALKTRTDTPNLTSILTRTAYQYQTIWVKGVPTSHRREIHVHVHRQLGI